MTEPQLCLLGGSAEQAPTRSHPTHSGGEGGLANFRFFLTRGRGGKPMSDFWLTRGEGGVWIPPFLAHIICEQPLIYYLKVVISLKID